MENDPYDAPTPCNIGAPVGHVIIFAVDLNESLHGNTQGLKPNQLRRIEKLYHAAFLRI